MDMIVERRPDAPPLWKTGIAFLILFALYQSAEGVGLRLLHAFPVTAGFMAAALAAAWPLGRWLGWRGYDAYALEVRPRAALTVLGAILAMLAVRAGALQLGVAAGVYRWETPHPAAAGAMALLVAGAALTTFIPSLAEDILTRGFLWRAAGWRWSAAAFAPVSAVVFLLNHVYRIADGWRPDLMILCMGLACASALARTGSLWAAVALHWGWNLSNALLDIVAPSVVTDAARAPLYSAAAWMAVLAAVWLAPLSARPASPRPRR
jgi:membrane protease YdiL (CAAX protease family)